MFPLAMVVHLVGPLENPWHPSSRLAVLVSSLSELLTPMIRGRWILINLRHILLARRTRQKIATKTKTNFAKAAYSKVCLNSRTHDLMIISAYHASSFNINELKWLTGAWMFPRGQPSSATRIF
jgi:hypothetical protein